MGSYLSRKVHPIIQYAKISDNTDKEIKVISIKTPSSNYVKLPKENSYSQKNDKINFSKLPYN